MEVQELPIDQLRPDPNQTRIHTKENLAAIRASLQEHGQVETLLVRRGLNHVIAGNGRIQVMKELGWKTASCNVMEMNDAQAKRLSVQMNRTGELAEWDERALADFIQKMIEDGDDVGELGFTEEQAQALIESMKVDLLDGDGEGAEDEDELPDLPKDPITRPGDVWLLGRHRLICGDSSDFSVIEKLMVAHGELADLVFTDPPYNVGEKLYGENSDAVSRKVLKGSDWDRGFNFEDFQGNILAALAEDASVYVCASHHTAPAIWTWMAKWSDFFGSCIWSKQNPMPSLSKRHWTWSSELICYATRGKHVFNFPKEGHCPNVWSFVKEAKCDLHPTMKPIPVVAHAISHSSNRKAIVADFFSGSGSTLIACEQLGRRCRAVEISPAYCDVIVARWERLTGKKAERAEATA